MDKVKVGLIGTGVAGEQFLVALANHPLFELRRVASAPNLAGQTLGKLLYNQWHGEDPLCDSFQGIVVEDSSKIEWRDLHCVFSAVDADVAKELEPRLAQYMPVISTASAFRYEPDVPILIPGVNIEHAFLINEQQKNRGWKGFIATIANCTTTGLAITLAGLHKKFGVQQVIMTSLQAISGAGRYPGILGLDIIDNILPYIHQEEEKVETEICKVLGNFVNQHIAPAPIAVSATCTRVPVLNGHTEVVNVGLAAPASLEEVKSAMLEFGHSSSLLKLPGSPSHLISITNNMLRPQPRLDRNAGNGMVITVGRMRKDPVLQNGFKYVLLTNNIRIGAAHGAVLIAAHLHAKGYIAS